MQKFKDIIAEVLKKKSFPFSNISELEGDASNRKYFKFHSNNTELILMLDNDKKSLKKFIKITNLIKKYVSVPKILADFSKENILILEDFGQTKYSEVMKTKNRQKLYMIAIDSLIEIQNKKFDNNEFYEGEVLNNKMHGKGTYFYPFIRLTSSTAMVPRSVVRIPRSSRPSPSMLGVRPGVIST